MNTDRAGAVRLALEVHAQVARVDDVHVAICPPLVYLDATGHALREVGSHVALGAQNVFYEPEGAYTGEVSARMLKDLGVRMVIAGHSERRHILGESDEVVGRKIGAIVGEGMTCILCVGETIEERRSGRTDAVNERQLRAGLARVEARHMDRIVIAYEPVWAIGSGVAATPADAQAAHAHIRNVLAEMFGKRVGQTTRILYGGSAKPENVAELLAQPDVDGGLVGGASLRAELFGAIVHLARPMA